MDWILYIFKRSPHIYLVAAESDDDAWRQLAQRQSISLENCTRQYKMCGAMNGNSNIKKIRG